MTLPVSATYLKRFVAVFRIRGCFRWLSSPIRTRVMADNNFIGHYRGQRGR